MYNNSANTKFTGKSIYFLPSCHSTNTVASDLIRAKEAVNGLIVITNEQTAGRGQQGNTWLSSANLNLTFSAIFFPTTYFIADSFYLNIISSLAVSETIEQFLPLDKQVSVKWPNDIYIGNKKVSGILIENTLRGDKIHSVVIGIGLNVNQSIFDLSQATSMNNESGDSFSLQEVLDVLFENLEKYYLLLNDGFKEDLLKVYNKKLYALNTLHVYEDKDGEFKGYVRVVEKNGTLNIETETGLKKKYQFKEVRFIIN